MREPPAARPAPATSRRAPAAAPARPRAGVRRPDAAAAARLPRHARGGRAARCGRSSRPGFDVALVVTRPDTRRGRGGALVAEPGQGGRRSSSACRSTDRVDDVLDVGADLGVVVAYGRLIRPPRARRACPMVNLHFSLLPRWRGAAPVERAILAGDAETGVCLMELEEGLDTGPVYGCERVADRARRDRRRAAGPAGRRRAPTCWSSACRAASASPSPRRASRPTRPRSTRPSCELDWARPAERARTGWCGSAGPGRRSGASGSRSCGRRSPTRGRRAGDARRARWSARATAASSSSRCSPRARARMPAVGVAQRGPAGAGRAARRDVPDPAAVALDALRAHRRRGRLRQPRPARAARAQPASTSATGPSSPSSCTAPPACGGPATAWSTASCMRALDPADPGRAAPRRLPARTSSARRPTPPWRHRRRGAAAGPGPRQRRAAPGGRRRRSSGPTRPPG